MEVQLRLGQRRSIRGSQAAKLWLAGGLAIATVSGAFPAQAYIGQEMADQARIGIAQARVIALKAHAGNIVSEELEKEPGGSGLRYSFDIKRGAVTQEIGIDAKTGKVLENAKEGPHPD
jgi:uncharacterized membrane protein YkoI